MSLDGITSEPQRICAACVTDLAVTGAGISFVTSTGSRSVVHTTDHVAASVEDLQATLGEGPCVDADRSGRPVLVPDLDDGTDPVIEAWPAFAEQASAVGVRALFAFPLRIGVVGIGVLDLYRTRPGGLAAAQLAGALRAADAAAHALLALGPSPGHGPQLDGGHDMRIHQATGMVKVQLGVTIDDAFLMLRARAFATGQSLSALATEVVERRLRFSQEDR